VQYQYLAFDFLIAFALGVALLPGYIVWLKHKQISQYIREEGPKAHVAKAKTPTTGGICFIVAILVSYLFSQCVSGHCNRLSVVVLAVAVLSGLIGLFDDLAKVRNQANAGVPALVRLSLECLLGAAFGILLRAGQLVGESPGIIVPSALSNFLVGLTTSGHFLVWQPPAWLFIFLSVFLVAATTNAINLHDGMDGLAGGTSAMVLATMALILGATNQADLARLAASACGAVLAFLVYNKYPAKIFMGDTGSLFLGGLMAALAIAGGLLLWFIPLTAIYIAETLSVMAQVVYFKLTKTYEPPVPISKLELIWLKLTKRLPGEGKRLFRMAPLHHHFEAVLAERSVPEWQVVAGFWLVQLLVCVAVFVTFLLY
jgi:phospho-N-acetylmuramoyl-pentapeptide-transferase